MPDSVWRLFSFRINPLLDKDTCAEVVARIRTVEAQTTGEIRVYMEPRCTYMDALDRAEEVFLRLRMDETERRNAVLLYLAWKDHQFAIFGDKAIYQVGGDALWQHATAALRQHLLSDDVKSALCTAVDEIGAVLARHFPPDPKVAKNELTDEIIFGK